MRAGRQYHRINFYTKVSTRDSYSASVDTYPTVTISCRGEVRDVGGSKSQSSEERFYSKNKELIIRYHPDITETMRVQIDGTESRYQITYIEEIGRKKGLILSLEKINL